jgi:hypothetical protein
MGRGVRLLLCVLVCVAVLETLRRYMGIVSHTVAGNGVANTTSPHVHAAAAPHFPLSLNSYNVCTKGAPLLERDFMLAELPLFLKVYSQRPVLDNKYGTQFGHQFAMWCAVRKVRPRHIIESGVNKGQGTWILRQAAPDAQLILLDPRDDGILYRDMRPDTRYFTGMHFQDFADISWSRLRVDVSRTLVYFDDHQAGVVRAHQATTRGFRYVMMDDNYDRDKYDNLSLKVACYVKLGRYARRDIMFKDNFGQTTHPLGYAELQLVDAVWERHIAHYMEFPLPWAPDDKRYDTLVKNNNADSKYTMANATAYFREPHTAFVHVCLVELNSLSASDLYSE